MATIETAWRKADVPACYHGSKIAIDRGTFTGVPVDPDTGRTLARLIFPSRGEKEAIPALPEEDEW